MTKNNKKTEDTNKDYSFDTYDDIDKLVDEKFQEEKNQGDFDIDDLKENLPVPGYMKTDLNEAVVKGPPNETGTINEEKCVAFELELTDKDADFIEFIYDKDGKPQIKQDGRKVTIFDPVFSMDLREHADGQISDDASTIVPKIIDQSVQFALDEKNTRNPDQRKPLFNYWWLILLMIMIPVIIVTLMIVRGGGGG